MKEYTAEDGEPAESVYQVISAAVRSYKLLPTAYGAPRVRRFHCPEAMALRCSESGANAAGGGGSHHRHQA